ncbi:hypothetical protein Skr01_46170 [Sphaerisporangium krabiense]|uniref:Uncharacterized protein n=1 Tax=Sphaerisporangium krabiense TaxID=763782 RepID=A0A7W8Z4P6_9ACTN|nr:hypothetical protein [Sphaerisporangium krabiense]MBB5627332.1 hypothetical protein [Sphaerisporangium krabiense]GII64532.1 hypothetical protein Skr01_46170 [Sphaerisporangium krabiense]
MNGTFDEKLLGELKAYMAERQAAGRAPRRTGRRLVMAVGAVGVAAAAAVTIPMVTGSATPAYAVTKNPDGSVTLTIREFRDPDAVERSLAAVGVPADIAYMPLGKWCDRNRYRPLPEDVAAIPTEEEAKSDDPQIGPRLRKRMENSPSKKAMRLKYGITIYPRYIRPGQTLVIDIAENDRRAADEPGVIMKLRGGLTEGPVQPCRLVDDVDAFEVGDATPPPGE